MKRLALIVCLGGLMGCLIQADSPGVPSTQPAPQSQPSSQPAKKKKVIQLPDVSIDLNTRTIIVNATVIRAQYMLEFMLCRAGTKEHESLMVTKAVPSHIHAGMLMLGLAPGKGGQYFEFEGKSHFISPRGAGLTMDVRWTDDKGKVHRQPVTDWIKSTDEGVKAKKTKPKQWVFLGSEMLPGGGYLADYDGGIIAIANLASAVIDVPFESIQPHKERAFTVDVDALPPSGTAVELIIKPVKGAENAPHARALVDINRHGQIRADGKPIEMHELGDWAFRYTQKHSKGMVVIRSDAEAMGLYSPMVRTELKIGGVFEFSEQTNPMITPLLPRTRLQADRSIDDWNDHFKNPKDYIREPGEEIQDTLEKIRIELEELQRLEALLKSYEQTLRTNLKSYKASTQPAEKTD